MDEAASLRTLLAAEPVRRRAHEMLALCLEDQIEHWRVDLAALPLVADFVLDVTRSAYPQLAIPFHSRWRHFETVDSQFMPGRPPALFDGLGAAERGRAAFDLAVVSVLLDAGAGAAWRYRSRDGVVRARSEGLALATLDLFRAGAFSSSRAAPLRVDADGLERIGREDLESGFQIRPENPLMAFDGRLQLLRALGRALRDRPDLFLCADVLRPGGLFDRFATTREGDSVTAPKILESLLEAFGPIWPSGLKSAGVALGDVGRHPAIRRTDATNGLVPFHKLSQWMAYSLIEPLEWAGVRVRDAEELTGLPEYRNGGLFIDLNALVPRRRALLDAPLRIGEPAIVELRALTVALLDLVAERMREKLRASARELPLARVLQGGSWAAGRAIAARLRPDGAPPFSIVSDGAVI